MKMLIVRHGEAEPNKGDDAARQLTDKGAEQVTALWQTLHDKEVKVRRLVASPFTRTRQTAELIAAFYPGLKIEFSDLLLSESEPEAVFAWLDQQPQQDGLVLVSHMPLVGILTGMLSDNAQARLAFVPGMVTCLDVEVAAVAGARLRWCISPETQIRCNEK